MKTLPLDTAGPRTLESLTLFLKGCQAQAMQDGEGVLVSIALKAGHLDPLAVLESIYEPGEMHFYVERSAEGFAMAGAEAALSFLPTGEDRFAQSQAYVDSILKRSIAVGDERLPFFGPHFFCSYSFSSQVSENAPFSPSVIFVPRWQVCSEGSSCVAIANAWLDADSDTARIAQRIWGAHAKFESFDYRDSGSKQAEDAKQPWRVIKETQVEEKGAFEQSVGQALAELQKGSFDKIVLARALDIEASQPFHPLEMLNALRESYPDCYAFSVSEGKGRSFIGSSPERLARFQNNILDTEALASSAPRGRTAGEDAAFARSLLQSDKDRREHRIVLDSILRRLESLGLSPKARETPQLKRLQNVQHLQVPISCSLPDDASIFDVLAQLHPTPAVGGSPRESACAMIPKLESFERGLYAGVIGWMNGRGRGEYLVGIRSALVEGTQARLYAGVGIVEGSDPAKELQETELKFQALKQSLL